MVMRSKLFELINMKNNLYRQRCIIVMIKKCYFWVIMLCKIIKQCLHILLL
jgi:hypothetical protein